MGTLLFAACEVAGARLAGGREGGPFRLFYLLQGVDELLTKALEALPEEAETAAGKAKKNFAQFLLESPLPGSGLKIERLKEYPRPIEL